MLFNSIHFAIFLPIVFILYWFIANKHLRIQNGLLLFASYFFYSCWDWRFLFLLVFSTLLDYLSAMKIEDSIKMRNKKIWFWISILINLGFLAIFKYFNFFSTSFARAISILGITVNPWTLKVILPVGISFYTFHGLSYVIDIYNNKIKAERNFIDYAVFVCFFPLLVAGPIERATHLLPQIKKTRRFEYSIAVDGLRQILWGLFKKIVIADQCAIYANLIFNNYNQYTTSGSTLLLGAVFFTFQIYADFSGYSDIAIGTAKLFGIDLLRNFAYPYFSRNIAEFWRRWHISLSSWFKDYVYIPLGGSKGSMWLKIRNTFIIFLLSGFWHGSKWTFIFWGLLNAIYILPSIIFKLNRNYLDTVAQDKHFPSIKESFAMICTFFLTVIAWIFFRSENIRNAFLFIIPIFKPSLFSIPLVLPVYLIIILIGFIIIEWISREKKHCLEMNHPILIKPIRLSIYAILTYSILFLLKYHDQTEFIYFQF